MEPYLLEAYGLVLRADFPCCTVSSPTSSGEEPAERVVVCVHPPAGTGKSIGAQGVRAGVQEPRAMASMLRCRIHNELASPSWLGMVVANPTTRWLSVATRTRNAACGGRSMAARQESVISVNETEASISSARSAGHWVAQDRRWSSAMLDASAGQARRTESAIGPPDAAVTGVMLSGLYPSSRGRR